MLKTISLVIMVLSLIACNTCDEDHSPRKFPPGDDREKSKHTKCVEKCEDLIRFEDLRDCHTYCRDINNE
jgi:hypothetical protein